MCHMSASVCLTRLKDVAPRTGSEVILEAVLNNQLLPRCLEAESLFHFERLKTPAVLATRGDAGPRGSRGAN
jgi:hypothetical protein